MKPKFRDSRTGKPVEEKVRERMKTPFRIKVMNEVKTQLKEMDELEESHPTTPREERRQETTERAARLIKRSWQILYSANMQRPKEERKSLLWN